MIQLGLVHKMRHPNRAVNGQPRRAMRNARGRLRPRYPVGASRDLRGRPA